jgi:hypothetical protein
VTTKKKEPGFIQVPPKTLLMISGWLLIIRRCAHFLVFGGLAVMISVSAEILDP